MEGKLYICKHCGKLFTDRYLLTGHSTHCDNNPKKLTKCNFDNYNKTPHINKINEYNECNCQYCNKLYFSLNSLKLHEIRCKENPNKIKFNTNAFDNFNKKIKDGVIDVWNKGLTMNTSDSVRKGAEKLLNLYNNKEILPSRLGKPHTLQAKQKIREGTINYLKTIIPGFQTRYNKNACKFINKLNKDKNWNLLHAENGGEIECIGYYLDGYDKEKNIVFEYDESKHYKDVYNNILHDKDIERQNNIINKLYCEFWRYNEKINYLYKVN